MSTAVTIDSRGTAAGAVPGIGALPKPHVRTRWWVEALTIGWLLWLYDAVTNMAPLRLAPALGHAAGVLRLEHALHIDPELRLDSWLAGHHTLGLLTSDYYDNAHFIVTLGLLGWLWWRRADIYRPLRNALVVTNLVAFAVFWLYPVAPPRMLSGFVDVVANTHAFGSWHAGALASHADELAAMPSLHMAWAAWCALAIWRLSARRAVRAIAILYPCVTAFAVLATGNHFVLDILAGMATFVLAVLLVRMGGAARRVAVPRLRRAASPIAERRRGRPSSDSVSPAYRMSQSCYEVQDQVD
ncbi:MAG TPA: phosphatase PAP2 family protein [Solirubrobacteraceae bacterium]